MLFWVIWAFVVTHTIKLCLSAGKKWISFPKFLWRYCKDMQTSCFGYFQHTWSCTPKMMVPTCKKLVDLYAKNQLHNSRPSWDITFWRILQFDWNTAFWTITWEPEFCQILFPQKANESKTKSWIQNTLFWGHFKLFLPKFG